MDLPDWNPHLYSGYLETLQPNRWHTSAADSPYFKFETSPTGLGANLKAAPAGNLYAAEAQYGFTVPGLPVPVTITPSAGFGYSAEPRPELPLRTPFSLGLALGAPIGPGRLAVEYGHMSNAGQKQPNIGLDNISVMYGLPLKGW